MAKIALRLYNREIENLVERGQTEEAIAHCKYILQAYPKHIETYRLLGKAFLESQRYSEATDIFFRILSSVPDDFVPHVGMSIIRENEGNLDDAIWHMERAFEVQPSNAAVQEELRRLYGRRDGFEPPRIRLTRGALVRMYARGDLYQQAIGEIRASLAVEPIRPDLQVLLAKMCFMAGQKIESTEICSDLLGKYPYCYEANRILADILPGTTRSEDAKIYLQRIFALDPYASQTTPEKPNVQDVPDNAITIERMDWQLPSQTESSNQQWASSLGINIAAMESENQALPEWLKSSQEAPTPTPQATSSEPISKMTAHLTGPSQVELEKIPPPEEKLAEEEGSLPDWMVSAGWQPSTGENVAPGDPLAGAIFGQEISSEDEIAPASIPDWLQSMAPPGISNESEVSADEIKAFEDLFAKQTGQLPPISETDSFASADKTEEVPAWLKGTGSLSSIGAKTREEEIPAFEAEMPDWLKDIQPDEKLETISTPGFQELEAGQAAPQTGKTSQPETTSEQENKIEPGLPDWLLEMQSTKPGIPVSSGPNSQNNTKLLDDTEADINFQSSEPTQTAQLDTNLPEWLKENSQQGTPLAQETPTGASGSSIGSEQASAFADDDATFAWLESLAAKQGADEGTLLVKPEDRSETPPDWIQKAVESESIEPKLNVPEAQIPEPVQTAFLNEGITAWLKEPESESGTDTLEPAQTAFLNEGITAWLKEPGSESAPETLEPAQTAFLNEGITAWLKEPGSESAPETLEPAQTAFLNEGITAWLKEPGAGSETETLEPAQPAEQIPQWLQEKKVPSEEPAVSPTNAVEMPMMGSDDDAFAWLESLAAKQGAPEETLLVKPEDRTGITPEWIKTASEPEPEVKVTNITEVIPPTHTAEPGQTRILGEVLPDWLNDEITTEAGTSTPVESTNEPFDWKKEVELPSQPESSTTGPENIPVLEDQDSAFAWLESLAAKQGAAEETLLVKPEGRSATAPEWVQKAVEDKTELESKPEEKPAQLPHEPAQTAILQDKYSGWNQAGITPESEAVQPAKAGEELPDWLKEMETSAETATTQPIPESKLAETPTLSEEDGTPTSLPETQAVPEVTEQAIIQPRETIEELPDWLKDMDITEQKQAIRAEATLPEWLQEVESKVASDVLAVPTQAYEEEKEEPSVVIPDESRVEFITPRPTTPPVSITAIRNLEQASQVLVESQEALTEGEIEHAVQGYSTLIKSNFMIEEAIHDLREALYRFPVDISLWQILGDAYVRSSRIQDGLDAYTKAEELLR